MARPLFLFHKVLLGITFFIYFNAHCGPFLFLFLFCLLCQIESPPAKLYIALI